MTKRVGMRGRVVETDTVRWTFGWNQDLLSFFLMKFDKSASVEDPVIHLGVRPREIPDGDGLFILARMAGLEIPESLLVQLYQDKDHQRHAYFVLHYPGEFGYGFKTDSLRHAEILKEALAPARPGEELTIRQIIEYE
jgi:hypothetical protein